MSSIFAPATEMPPLSYRRSASDTEALWDLEEQFWAAGFETGNPTNAKGNVVIFFTLPEPFQDFGKRAYLKRVFKWQSITITDRNLDFCGDIAVLAYHAQAERLGKESYSAYCATTYLCDENKWLRMSHLRTPVP